MENVAVQQGGVLSLKNMLGLVTGEFRPFQKTIYARRVTRKHWLMLRNPDLPIQPVNTGMRVCNHCERMLTLSHFYANAAGRHFGQCKECYNRLRYRKGRKVSKPVMQKVEKSYEEN